MGSGLLRFFGLTFALSWSIIAAGEAISRVVPWSAPALAGLRGVLLFAGTITPSLVALWLTARAEGSAGTEALFRRIFQWRVNARWYLFAVGYMIAIKLAVALVHRVATGAWPRFGQEAWYLILLAIAFSTWVQAGEEIGWRGYALPRLAERLGLARAGLLLGVVWAVWHLPGFFIPGNANTGQSFPVFLLQVTALSIALAWLYWRTGGSLLLAMLMHAAVNNSSGIVPSVEPGATTPLSLSGSPVAWLTVALLWIGAGYFLIRMRGATLGHHTPTASTARIEPASPA